MRHLVPSVMLAALLALTAACGPNKLEPPPTPTAAKYPDFVLPAIPEGLGTPAAQERHNAGWLWLQVGDLKAAERNFEATLKASPDFYPSEAGLGYVGLAKKDANEAVNHFDRAIVENPRYAPALVGRGEALLALGQRDNALKSFEAAVGADANLSALRTRIEVLRGRVLQDDVDAARKAVAGGQFEEAKRAYERAIASSPDSPFLYRELADIARKQGNLDLALQQAQKAAAMDAAEPRVQILLGEIFEARGDSTNALAAYEAANALEKSGATERKIESLRDSAALAAMPAEFKAIETSPNVSREQLAALLGARLDELFKRDQRANAIVITDTRGSWATPWILAVTRAGVMEVYPNHTFQPSALVKRGDLAETSSRVLSLIAAQKPALASSWRNGKRDFIDVPPAHLSHGAASITVGAGVMQPLADGSFDLTRPVTGAEAVAAVKRLEELADNALNRVP